MRLAYLLLPAVLLFIKPSQLSAQTVTIYRGGTAISPTYSSIKAAVAAALSEDSLVLEARVYYENNIRIDKSMSINGTKGSIIDGLYSYPDFSSVFRIYNPVPAGAAVTVCFRDVTIRNAMANRSTTNGGGAIFADQGVDIILAGKTLLTKNESGPSPGYMGSDYGGGIYCKGGNVLMRDSAAITNNLIGKYGGGLYVHGSVTLMDQASCSGNRAGSSGGGIYCSGKVRLLGQAAVEYNRSGNGGGIYATGGIYAGDNSRIRYNTASDYGGGIYAQDTVYLIGAVSIDSNNAGSGGGVYVTEYLQAGDTVTLNGNGAARGGALYLLKGGCLSGRLQIDGNGASSGGGLFLAGNMTISDSVRITRNTSVTNGAGIYATAAQLGLSNTSLVAGNHSKGAGAGLYLLGSTLTMSDSTIIGLNTTDTDYAAGIYCRGCAIRISSGQIIGNRSSYDSVKGSGMALYIDTSTSHVPEVSVHRARIFNPNGDTLQQNEVYNIHPDLIFRSDSTWWGDSDTTGVFHHMPSSSFYLDSWVQATWSINSGMPVGSASSFPIMSVFHLNTGASLPPLMFWMLVSRFTCSEGSFVPEWRPMEFFNTTSSRYHVPAGSGSITMVVHTDADTFRSDVDVIGLRLNVPPAASPFRIYPNPSSGIFYFDVPATPVSIKVYDLSGRIILKEEHPGKNIFLKAQPGTYLLELLDQEGNRLREKIELR